MEKFSSNLSIFNKPCFIVTKKLCVYFGLWPELSNRQRFTSMVLHITFMLSFLIPILIGTVHEVQRSEWANALENNLELIAGVTVLELYIITYFSKSRIFSILKEIECVWNTLKDKDELNILTKYLETARVSMMSYLFYGGFMAFLEVVYLCEPMLMDLLNPLEKKREPLKLFHPYFFDIIDLNKYYFEYLLYTLVVVICNFVFNIVAMIGMVTIIITHICSLFDVTWLANLIWDIYDFSCFCIVLSTTAGFGMGVFHIWCYQSEPFKKSIMITWLIMVEIVLFGINFMIQKLVDGNASVFQALYNSDWYKLSPKERNLVYFLMLRTLKPMRFEACGLIELNLQRYSRLVNASVSFALCMSSFKN